MRSGWKIDTHSFQKQRRNYRSIDNPRLLTIKQLGNGQTIQHNHLNMLFSHLHTLSTPAFEIGVFPKNFDRKPSEFSKTYAILGVNEIPGKKIVMFFRRMILCFELQFKIWYYHMLIYFQTIQKIG